jgi:prophage regulatory protein
MTASQTEPEVDGAPDDKPRPMLSEKQVLAIIPVGRTTLWRLERSGRFPRSTYISPNRRVWYEDEILRWQREIDGRARGWRTGDRKTEDETMK